MGILPRFWWVPLGKVPEIDASALYQALSAARRPQILDVRTRLEFNRGHIEGAVQVPMRELRSQVETLPFDRQRPVVAVCLSAHRSIPAVRLLKAHGFTDVAQLAGGMIAWRRKGLPTRSRV
ncbi:rhodanese-like domain-containing protein [Desulfatitalea tepidiphila]|uniref:rhodanese-like domain-containing protein n=1 Tax=Desulfatitalea tepidiphila TaxID=1185843 RepID=UPI0006B4C66B